MKKFAVVSSLLLLIAVVFVGCAAPPPPEPEPTPPPDSMPQQPALTINASTDKWAYAIGEELVVSVRAEQPCYVTIFNVSPDGIVTRIFPNGLASNNYIQGQQIYHIPNPSDRFRLQVTRQRGGERLRVIATLENVNIVAPRLTNESFPVFNGTPEQFDEAIDQQLATLPAASWADTKLMFQVQ